MNVTVLGCGNVGVAIAADLSIGGHDVHLIKTSHTKESVFDKIRQNGNRVLLKENGGYKTAIIKEVSHDISRVEQADAVFVTIQSTYHEELIERISRYLHHRQVVVCICSYLSSLYFKKYCRFLPAIVETAGPYLEGRIELDDRPDEVVFRVGCRLSRSPLSIFQEERAEECLTKLHQLYKGFSRDYTTLECALQNPNMILHTVGSVMSIPRIEYSEGDFCMYREAYSRKNKATLQVMLRLDAEKRLVLEKLGCRPADIFKAGGFLGDPMESFYQYSESADRAVSPTSVRSRYITEDVSQGLVLMESIGKKLGIATPVTSSLITIAGAALGVDFRAVGRTVDKLGLRIGSN